MQSLIQSRKQHENLDHEKRDEIDVRIDYDEQML